MAIHTRTPSAYFCRACQEPSATITCDDCGVYIPSLLTDTEKPSTMTTDNMHTVLKFAQQYGATNVTLEFDYGTLTVSPSRALEEFDLMTLDDPFTIHSISFN